METGNQISEYGRVEISKNISNDRAYARYVSAATVFPSLRRYWRLALERTFRFDAVFQNATVRLIRRYNGDRRFSGKMEKRRSEEATIPTLSR